MLEPIAKLSPRSPLQAVALPGEHGRIGPDGPGVTFQERRALAVMSVMARNGGSDAVAEAVKSGLALDLPAPTRSAEGGGLALLWTGLDRWLAVSAAESGPALLSRLQTALGDSAALADQSSGLCVLSLTGPKFPALMHKGPAIDLHPSAFKPGDTAPTAINHTSVLLRRPESGDGLHLFVHRGFARDLFEYLTTMAAEYGYLIVEAE